MDPQTFDRLARTFSQSASRRRALGGLLGAALAGVAGTSEAKRRHQRHGKGHEATKVSASDCAKFCTAVFPPGPHRGQCISDAAHGTGVCARCQANPANFCNGTCCTGSQTCQDGTCQCPEGTTSCAGQCVDRQTDPNNCGACGRACGSNQTCANGTCLCAGTPCPSDWTCLDNGTCVQPCSHSAECHGQCGCFLFIENVPGFCLSIPLGTCSGDFASCPQGQVCLGDTLGDTCYDATFCLPS